MGSVYRPMYTRPMPEGAEIVTRKGERVATWTDAKGKRQSAALSADGKRVRQRSRNYTAKYRDGTGIVRTRATGCRDKSAAQAVLRDLMTRSDNVRAGVRTAAEDATLDHASTPVNEHVRDYLGHLRSKRSAKGKVSAHHVVNVEYALEDIIVGCGISRLRDIDRKGIERWAAGRQAGGEHSARTINTRIVALQAFVNWCVDEQRLASNPIGRAPKVEESDKARQRRALTEDELHRLFYAARWRPLAEQGRETVKLPEAERVGRRTWTYKALTYETIDECAGRAREKASADRITKLEREGLEREAVYRTLFYTGLRTGELASLTVGDFALDTETPTVELRASNAKAGKAARIPLRSDLAAMIRDVFKSRDGAGNKAFTVPSIRVFDRDLEAAGIEKRDARGRTVDLHALRTSLATHLSATGAHPRVAMQALRHASPTMTLATYTDGDLMDVGKASEALPAIAESTDGRPLAPILAPDSADVSGILHIPADSHENGTDSTSGENADETEDMGSQWGGSSKRATGIEPATFSLEGGEGQTETSITSALTALEADACTDTCTDTGTEKPMPADASDTVTALAMLERLALTDGERAAVVRRIAAAESRLPRPPEIATNGVAWQSALRAL